MKKCYGYHSSFGVIYMLMMHNQVKLDGFGKGLVYLEKGYALMPQ